jgi:hypothetical protein
MVTVVVGGGLISRSSSLEAREEFEVWCQGSAGMSRDHVMLNPWCACNGPAFLSCLIPHTVAVSVNIHVGIISILADVSFIFTYENSTNYSRNF